MSDGALNGGLNPGEDASPNPFVIQLQKLADAGKHERMLKLVLLWKREKQNLLTNEAPCARVTHADLASITMPSGDHSLLDYVMDLQEAQQAPVDYHFELTKALSKTTKTSRMKKAANHAINREYRREKAAAKASDSTPPNRTDYAPLTSNQVKAFRDDYVGKWNAFIENKLNLVITEGVSLSTLTQTEILGLFKEFNNDHVTKHEASHPHHKLQSVIIAQTQTQLQQQGVKRNRALKHKRLAQQANQMHIIMYENHDQHLTVSKTEKALASAYAQNAEIQPAGDGAARDLGAILNYVKPQQGVRAFKLKPMSRWQRFLDVAIRRVGWVRRLNAYSIYMKLLREDQSSLQQLATECTLEENPKLFSFLARDKIGKALKQYGYHGHRLHWKEIERSEIPSKESKNAALVAKYAHANNNAQTVGKAATEALPLPGADQLEANQEAGAIVAAAKNDFFAGPARTQITTTTQTSTNAATSAEVKFDSLAEVAINGQDLSLAVSMDELDTVFNQRFLAMVRFLFERAENADKKSIENNPEEDTLLGEIDSPQALFDAFVGMSNSPISCNDFIEALEGKEKQVSERSESSLFHDLMTTYEILSFDHIDWAALEKPYLEKALYWLAKEHKPGMVESCNNLQELSDAFKDENNPLNIRDFILEIHKTAPEETRDCCYENDVDLNGIDNDYLYEFNRWLSQSHKSYPLVGHAFRYLEVAKKQDADTDPGMMPLLRSFFSSETVSEKISCQSIESMLTLTDEYNNWIKGASEDVLTIDTLPTGFYIKGNVLCYDNTVAKVQASRQSNLRMPGHLFQPSVNSPLSEASGFDAPVVQGGYHVLDSDSMINAFWARYERVPEVMTALASDGAPDSTEDKPELQGRSKNYDSFLDFMLSLSDEQLANANKVNELIATHDTNPFIQKPVHDYWLHHISRAHGDLGKVYMKQWCASALKAKQMTEGVDYQVAYAESLEEGDNAIEVYTIDYDKSIVPEGDVSLSFLPVLLAQKDQNKLQAAEKAKLEAEHKSIKVRVPEVRRLSRKSDVAQLAQKIISHPKLEHLSQSIGDMTILQGILNRGEPFGPGGNTVDSIKERFLQWCMSACTVSGEPESLITHLFNRIMTDKCNSNESKASAFLMCSLANIRTGGAIRKGSSVDHFSVRKALILHEQLIAIMKICGGTHNLPKVLLQGMRRGDSLKAMTDICRFVLLQIQCIDSSPLQCFFQGRNDANDFQIDMVVQWLDKSSDEEAQAVVDEAINQYNAVPHNAGLPFKMGDNSYHTSRARGEIKKIIIEAIKVKVQEQCKESAHESMTVMDENDAAIDAVQNAMKYEKEHIETVIDQWLLPKSGLEAMPEAGVSRDALIADLSHMNALIDPMQKWLRIDPKEDQASYLVRIRDLVQGIKSANLAQNTDKDANHPLFYALGGRDNLADGSDNDASDAESDDEEANDESEAKQLFDENDPQSADAVAHLKSIKDEPAALKQYARLVLLALMRELHFKQTSGRDGSKKPGEWLRMEQAMTALLLEDPVMMGVATSEGKTLTIGMHALMQSILGKDCTIITHTETEAKDGKEKIEQLAAIMCDDPEYLTTFESGEEGAIHYSDLTHAVNKHMIQKHAMSKQATEHAGPEGGLGGSADDTRKTSRHVVFDEVDNTALDVAAESSIVYSKEGMGAFVDNEFEAFLAFMLNLDEGILNDTEAVKQEIAALENRGPAARFWARELGERQGFECPAMLVDAMITQWSRSTLQAHRFKEGHEYFVEKKSDDPDALHEVIILQKSTTGKSAPDSEWSFGLHALVAKKVKSSRKDIEVKVPHMSQVIMESHSCAYIRELIQEGCSVSSLTGTLGTEVDIDYMKDVLNAQPLVMPRAKRISLELKEEGEATLDEQMNRVLLNENDPLLSKEEKEHPKVVGSTNRRLDVATHFVLNQDAQFAQIKAHLDWCYDNDYSALAFLESKEDCEKFRQYLDEQGEEREDHLIKVYADTDADVDRDTKQDNQDAAIRTAKQKKGLLITTMALSRGTNFGQVDVCIQGMDVNARAAEQAKARIARNFKSGISLEVVVNPALNAKLPKQRGLLAKNKRLRLPAGKTKVEKSDIKPVSNFIAESQAVRSKQVVNAAKRLEMEITLKARLQDTHLLPGGKMGQGDMLARWNCFSKVVPVLFQFDEQDYKADGNHDFSKQDALHQGWDALFPEFSWNKAMPNAAQAEGDHKPHQGMQP